MRQKDLFYLEIEIDKAFDSADGGRRTGLYKLLKRKLSERGYWKNLPRGKPDPNNLKT